ncbi:unnamed protein product, partial [Adineta steineri]
MKSSHLSKTTIHSISEDSDSDDSMNNNNLCKMQRLDNYKTNLSCSQTNKSIDSRFFNDDNYLEGK